MSVARAPGPGPSVPIIRRRRKQHRIVWRFGAVGIVLAALLCWKGTKLWTSGFHQLALRSIQSHEPETALYWLGWADLPGFSDPNTSLIRIQAVRRIGDGPKLEAALFEAEHRGADYESLQRQRILYAAQCGQMRESEPFLSVLLTDKSVDNTDVCLAYVTGFLRNQRSAEAMTLVEAWLKDTPSDPTPWFIRGRMKRLEDNLQAAESDLRIAVKLSATWMEPAVELAEVLGDTGRPAEAIALYEKAMADGRVKQRAAVGLAVCLKSAGDTGRALFVLQQELASSPTNINARMELGRTQLENAEYLKAVSTLETVVKARPYDDEARFLLAQCLRQTGRRVEALEHLKVVTAARTALTELGSLREQIKQNPRNEALLLRAGELLLNYSDPEEGILTLLSVVDLNPRNSEAHRMIAEYYSTNSRNNAAFQKLAAYHRTRYESVK